MNLKCIYPAQLSRSLLKCTIVLTLVVILTFPSETFGDTVKRRRKRLDNSRRRFRHGNLNMWIDERQVRLFSGKAKV